MEYYIDPVTFVTQESGFESRYIKNLLGLLDEGATIPFISRYRKEMTGSMDEVQVGQVREIYEQFKELEKRKKTVLESIEQQEKLTQELRKQIELVPIYENWKIFTCLINRRNRHGRQRQKRRVGTFGSHVDETG